jgi:hypothetical protein
MGGMTGGAKFAHGRERGEVTSKVPLADNGPLSGTYPGNTPSGASMRSVRWLLLLQPLTRRGATSRNITREDLSVDWDLVHRVIRTTARQLRGVEEM